MKDHGRLLFEMLAVSRPLGPELSDETEPAAFLREILRRTGSEKHPRGPGAMMAALVGRQDQQISPPGADELEVARLFRGEVVEVVRVPIEVDPDLLRKPIGLLPQADPRIEHCLEVGHLLGHPLGGSVGDREHLPT